MSESTTTTRKTFDAGTPVWINFKGAIGVKEGHVVADEGADKITVRYAKKDGSESEKAVKWNLVVAREVTDEVPVVDVNAEPAEAEEPTQPATEEAEVIELHPATEEEPAIVTDAADDCHHNPAACEEEAEPVTEEAPEPTPATDTGAPVVKFVSAQKTQKKTAAAYFADGTHGASWDGTATLTVTDPAAAAAWLQAAIDGEAETLTPKVSLVAVHKKIAALI